MQPRSLTATNPLSRSLSSESLNGIAHDRSPRTAYVNAQTPTALSGGLINRIRGNLGSATSRPNTYPVNFNEGEIPQAEHADDQFAIDIRPEDGAPEVHAEVRPDHVAIDIRPENDVAPPHNEHVVIDIHAGPIDQVSTTLSDVRQKLLEEKGRNFSVENLIDYLQAKESPENRNLVNSYVQLQGIDQDKLKEIKSNIGAAGTRDALGGYLLSCIGTLPTLVSFSSKNFLEKNAIAVNKLSLGISVGSIVAAPFINTYFEFFMGGLQTRLKEKGLSGQSEAMKNAPEYAKLIQDMNKNRELMETEIQTLSAAFENPDLTPVQATELLEAANKLILDADKLDGQYAIKKELLSIAVEGQKLQSVCRFSTGMLTALNAVLSYSEEPLAASLVSTLSAAVTLGVQPFVVAPRDFQNKFNRHLELTARTTEIQYEGAPLTLEVLNGLRDRGVSTLNLPELAAQSPGPYVTRLGMFQECLESKIADVQQQIAAKLNMTAFELRIFDDLSTRVGPLNEADTIQLDQLRNRKTNAENLQSTAPLSIGNQIKTGLGLANTDSLDDLNAKLNQLKLDLEEMKTFSTEENWDVVQSRMSDSSKQELCWHLTGESFSDRLWASKQVASARWYKVAECSAEIAQRLSISVTQVVLQTAVMHMGRKNAEVTDYNANLPLPTTSLPQTIVSNITRLAGGETVSETPKPTSSDSKMEKPYSSGSVLAASLVSSISLAILSGMSPWKFRYKSNQRNKNTDAVNAGQREKSGFIDLGLAVSNTGAAIFFPYNVPSEDKRMSEAAAQSKTAKNNLVQRRELLKALRPLAGEEVSQNPDLDPDPDHTIAQAARISNSSVGAPDALPDHIAIDMEHIGSEEVSEVHDGEVREVPDGEVREVLNQVLLQLPENVRTEVNTLVQDSNDAEVREVLNEIIQTIELSEGIKTELNASGTQEVNPEVYEAVMDMLQQLVNSAESKTTSA